MVKDRLFNWSQQRLDQIRFMLSRKGEVSISELAREYNVSEMTIRRDLDLLESKGEAVRTHGGAMCGKQLTFQLTFLAEQNRNLEAKQWIAKKAVQYVRDGEVIILDTGTTTLEVARCLVDRRKVTVITLSLPVVSAVQFDPNIEVILLGGYLRGKSPDLHGPLTEQNLGMFKADVAFLGAGGIDADGSVYTDDLRVLSADRKMVEISKKVIVVADSGKFSAKTMCKVIGPESYHVLITDVNADAEIVEKIRERGVQVELVGRKKAKKEEAELRVELKRKIAEEKKDEPQRHKEEKI